MFSRLSSHARATDFTFLVKSMYNSIIALTGQSVKEISAKSGQQGVTYIVNFQKKHTPPKA